MTRKKPVGSSGRLIKFVLFMAVVTFISTVIVLVNVVRYVNDLEASRRRQESLRGIRESMAVTAEAAAETFAEAAETAEMYMAEEALEVRELTDFETAMLGINPNFAAWITIDGTNIDYPVVRYVDNVRYLDMSFDGEESVFGTPFMDYRLTGEFEPHLIIYGHNTRHGNMFSQLHGLLGGQFAENAPVITLNKDGRVTEYEIFGARRTDVRDYAYFLDFSYNGAFQSFLERIGAPPDAVQIITLSTCVSGNNPDERVVVQGALRQNKAE